MIDYSLEQLFKNVTIQVYILRILHTCVCVCVCVCVWERERKREKWKPKGGAVRGTRSP